MTGHSSDTRWSLRYNWESWTKMFPVALTAAQKFWMQEKICICTKNKTYDILFKPNKWTCSRPIYKKLSSGIVEENRQQLRFASKGTTIYDKHIWRLLVRWGSSIGNRIFFTNIQSYWHASTTKKITNKNQMLQTERSMVTLNSTEQSINTVSISNVTHGVVYSSESKTVIKFPVDAKCVSAKFPWKPVEIPIFANQYIV